MPQLACWKRAPGVTWRGASESDALSRGGHGVPAVWLTANQQVLKEEVARQRGRGGEGAERLWANSCLYLQKLYKLVVVSCCLTVCKRIGYDAAVSVHVAMKLGRSPTSPVHPPFARVYFLWDS